MNGYPDAKLIVQWVRTDTFTNKTVTIPMQYISFAKTFAVYFIVGFIIGRIIALLISKGI